eukprot:4397593-Amphidinium_carterae.1
MAFGWHVHVKQHGKKLGHTALMSEPLVKIWLHLAYLCGICMETEGGCLSLSALIPGQWHQQDWRCQGVVPVACARIGTVNSERLAKLLKHAIPLDERHCHSVSVCQRTT